MNFIECLHRFYLVNLIYYSVNNLIEHYWFSLSILLLISFAYMYYPLYNLSKILGFQLLVPITISSELLIQLVFLVPANVICDR